MAYAYDFAKIKIDHPIEKVAERLGLQLKPHGPALRCQCPSGEGDQRGMVVTPAKASWYSFPAQKGGDVISLVSFARGLSAKEAAAWIAGNQATEPEKSTSTKATSKEGFKELDYLDPDHEAVIALGFDPDDAKRIGVGFSPRGLMRGTVCIPVRDKTGKLLGYVGTCDLRLPPKWEF